MIRLQKIIFAVAGVRRQGAGVSKNKEFWIWFIAELFMSRLFAAPSVILILFANPDGQDLFDGLGLQAHFMKFSGQFYSDCYISLAFEGYSGFSDSVCIFDRLGYFDFFFSVH
jgi:hypothetical protein